jgi:hypothetical protein
LTAFIHRHDRHGEGDDPAPVPTGCTRGRCGHEHDATQPGAACAPRISRKVNMLSQAVVCGLHDVAEADADVLGG